MWKKNLGLINSSWWDAINFFLHLWRGQVISDVIVFFGMVWPTINRLQQQQNRTTDKTKARRIDFHKQKKLTGFNEINLYDASEMDIQWANQSSGPTLPFSPSLPSSLSVCFFRYSMLLRANFVLFKMWALVNYVQCCVCVWRGRYWRHLHGFIR